MTHLKFVWKLQMSLTVALNVILWSTWISLMEQQVSIDVVVSRLSSCTKSVRVDKFIQFHLIRPSLIPPVILFPL